MFNRATSLVVLAANAILASALTLNPTTCYTLSRNDTQYLDSTNSVLKIQEHTDRAALERGDDKGVRFHFPTGENGWVVCEAHNDHFVGTTIPDATEWSTFDSEGAVVALATIHIASEQVFINAGPRRQLSSTSGVTNVQYNWDIRVINCLVEGQ